MHTIALLFGPRHLAPGPVPVPVPVARPAAAVDSASSDAGARACWSSVVKNAPTRSSSSARDALPSSSAAEPKAGGGDGDAEAEEGSANALLKNSAEDLEDDKNDARGSAAAVEQKAEAAAQSTRTHVGNFRVDLDYSCRDNSCRLPSGKRPTRASCIVYRACMAGWWCSSTFYTIPLLATCMVLYEFANLWKPRFGG